MKTLSVSEAKMKLRGDFSPHAKSGGGKRKVDSTSAKKYNQSDSASMSLLFAKAFGKTQRDFTLGDLCPLTPALSPATGERGW